VLEARQRATVWLSFAVGFCLAALAQRPGRNHDGVAASSSARLPAQVLETSPGSLDSPLEREIADTAMRHNLDPALVQAVIEAESGYDPRAVSPKGAIGLMQILPDTAAEIGLPEPVDPAASLEGGCRYLAALQEIFGGNVELALAAYNAGPGAVRRWGSVPPYRETKEFVRRVGENYRRLTGLDVSMATRYTTDASAVL
jgi:soluble lytic murein transglycosylase-like protein